MFVLYDSRAHSTSVLFNNSMNEYPCLQNICCPRQADRIKNVVHLTLVARVNKVDKHIEHSSMHRAHTFVYPFLIDRLIEKVKFICKTIISNEISLDAIPNPFELPTSSFILALPLHLASLLVDGKFLFQNPSFLPNITTPTK